MLDISCQLHILRYLVFCCLEEKTGWLWHWTWLDLNVSYEKNSRNLLDVSHDSSIIAELGFVTLTRESGYKPFFKQNILRKNRLSSINPLLVSLQRFCICLFFVWCGPWLGIEPRTSRTRSLSVYTSCKGNFSLMDKLMLMKLYRVVFYNLRMCMKEDNLGPKYFKGDY